MKLRRIKNLQVNSYRFNVKWSSSLHGARFSYDERVIEIGTTGMSELEQFMVVCHELWEICAVEMNVRLSRPDCMSDYIFVYDHRQHETMANMFAGLLAQFLQVGTE